MNKNLVVVSKALGKICKIDPYVNIHHLRFLVEIGVKTNASVPALVKHFKVPRENGYEKIKRLSTAGLIVKHGKGIPQEFKLTAKGNRIISALLAIKD